MAPIVEVNNNIVAGLVAPATFLGQSRHEKDVGRKVSQICHEEIILSNLETPTIS
jgi:hypothetical protein